MRPPTKRTEKTFWPSTGRPLTVNCLAGALIDGYTKFSLMNIYTAPASIATLDGSVIINFALEGIGLVVSNANRISV